MMNKPKVIIIGAGASGIAAATRLLENGIEDVIILEAENRIGGRIYSTNFGGSIIDLGAQWCHGEEDNVVFKLAKDLNVLRSSFNTYRDNTYYESTGRVLDKTLTDQLFEISEEILYDKESLKEAKTSLGEYFFKSYNEKVQKQFSNTKELVIARDMLNWFRKFYISIDGATNWYDISPSELTHYKQCAGDGLLNWQNKGYKTILDIMMKKLPDPSTKLCMDNRIILNKEVSRIKWNDYQRQLNVICSDGTDYKADYVIVTVSVAVLKEKYKTLFVPELPLYKQNAIEGLGYGTANKIFLKFDHKWWPDNCTGFSLVWTDTDVQIFLKEFPHSCEDEALWLQDVFGFYVIDNNPSILLGWLVGPYAAGAELLADNVLIDGCYYLLKKFLGAIYDVSKPDKILCSKWHSNPHFRGVYSYRSLETEKRRTSARELAQPVIANNKEALLFAGEATHSDYFSTVHGAIESGYREAERIINTYSFGYLNGLQSKF